MQRERRGVPDWGWAESEEALWVRRVLLCSAGGRGGFGEEAGLDFVVRSLWGMQSGLEYSSAPRSFVVGQCGTPPVFQVHCLVRSGGLWAPLSGEQWMDCKLGRKHGGLRCS